MYLRAQSLLTVLALVTLTPAATAAPDEWTFTEVSVAAGVRFPHAVSGTTTPEYAVAGAAAGDYDDDGWLDLFVVGGDLHPNHLLRNLGDGTFEDRSLADAGLPETSSIDAGPAFVDLDGDGRLDLWLGGVDQPIRIFRNLGGTFTSIEDTGLPTFDVSFGPAFADIDGDGDLDAFIPQWNSDPAELLWRNDGDFHFTPITATAFDSSTHDKLLYTFTPNFTDLNRDGHPDLVVASDYNHSEALLNLGDGTFQRATDEEVIKDENGMGAAIGDFDNDGHLDWLVTSILGTNQIYGNRLYRGTGDGTFSDVTDQAGVADGGWGWGACLADFNNDGALDIFHVNGWHTILHQTQVSRLFIANGDGSFTERAVELGIDDTESGRGVVCLDYDRDGDIDLFISNNRGETRLYRNDGGNALPSLSVQLQGPENNTYGVGAMLTLTTSSGSSRIREIRCGNNYVTQNPMMAHFGLGSERALRLAVHWATGKESKVPTPASGEMEVSATAIFHGNFESGDLDDWSPDTR